MGDPKKNTDYTFHVGLADQANRPQLKSNPTLATGDFKVSTDGGAFTNLATLPTVTPSGGKAVQIALNAGEMNGDTVVVLCSDAAGAEWDDLLITLTTKLRSVDDLLPTASYTAPANSDITAIKAKTDNLPADPASNTQVNTRLATASYTAPDNSGITTIQAKTDQLTFSTANRVDARAITVADKTGYALSSTGLDTVAAPTDLPNDAAARASFVGMIRALFNRFYDNVTQTADEQKVRNDSGTVVSTMAVSTDGTTQTKGKSV